MSEEKLETEAEVRAFFDALGMEYVRESSHVGGNPGRCIVRARYAQMPLKGHLYLVASAAWERGAARAKKEVR